MPNLPDETIDGRLLALRKVLAHLIADLAPQLGGQAWLDRVLPDEQVPEDAQEDPGAVPDPAFAIEAALADEREALGHEVRRLMEYADKP